MRSPALLAALVAVTTSAGCAVRDRPFRFASPMLGMAQVPPPPLPGYPPPPKPPLENRDARAIRVVSAPKIREASAAAALAVIDAPAAREDARAGLPAPHRLPPTITLAPVRSVTELRALVGRRDKRDPFAIVFQWTRELGLPLEGFDGSTGADLVAWAEASQRLAEPTDEPVPGDLLVFDHVASDDAADLVSIVIARDARGVTELAYIGGGVIRRGFVDPTRPAMRRDADQLVVNTYLRHGRRWPQKGTHYLAGELVAHVIHTR